MTLRIRVLAGAAMVVAAGLLGTLCAGADARPGPAEAGGDTSWVRQLPRVTAIRTVPAIPNADEPTLLVIEGSFPLPCGEVRDAHTVDPSHVSITLYGDPTCADSTTSVWIREFPLGFLQPGPQRVQVDITELIGPRPLDPTTYVGWYHFAVGGDSIPGPGPLPFIHELQVGPRPIWPPFVRPLCPGDSIWVHARGEFPTPCYSLRGIELLPPPIGSPQSQPPIVRFVIDENRCLERVCLQVPTPWEAGILLPPLPARDHQLIAEVGVAECPSSPPPDSTLRSARFPFRVDACGQPAVCLMGGWRHRPGEECDAVVSPGHPGRVEFVVTAGDSLAGLQGVFHAGRGLSIEAIEPVGPASGMRLTWTPTMDGARFSMFAEHGAPIPSTGPGRRFGTPVLELTIAARAGTRFPGHVAAGELLASDEHGNALPGCPAGGLDVAHICGGASCDFNADGRTDVRDLVRMAHCVLWVAADSAENVYRAPCPDSTRIPDCDEDGAKDLRDVLCCARELLRDPDCPDCPADTSRPVPAPGVGASLGTPEITAAAVEVPVSLGSGSFGGAVVELGFPADRYDAELVAPDEHGGLFLSDVAGDRVTFGVVRFGMLAGPFSHPVDQRGIRLRLTLKPGRAHGGTVTICSADFSSNEGARLETPPPGSPATIDARLNIGIEDARPNPFSAEAQFTLTLDRPARVTVAIHDIGGRRVATLHDGGLASGTHPFTWNGTRDGRDAVPGGVYFYRAASGGETVTRMLVFLGR